MKQNTENIVSLKDIILKIQYLYFESKKKWMQILIISILFASIGLTISILIKPKYTAKLSFVLEEKGIESSLTAISGLASQFGLMTSGNNSTFSQDNLVEILQSKYIISKSLLTLNNINNKDILLINYYISFNKLKENWKDNLKMKDFQIENSEKPQLTRLNDSIITVIYKQIKTDNLKVEKVKSQLNIIEITAESRNDLFSKLLTENLIKSITDFYIDTKTKRARETFNFLQKRADSTKTALDAAELELAKWQDSKFQLVKYEGQIERTRLFRQVQILQIIYSEMLKNLELSKMNLLNVTPLIKIIDSPILPLDTFILPKSILTISGFAIGFILSIIFIFIRLLYKEALKKTDEKD